MNVLFGFMYVDHAYAWCLKNAKKGFRSLSTGIGYRWLCAIMGLPGIRHGSSVRAAIVLNHSVIFPAP